MAKKTFKENPAFQFISEPEAETNEMPSDEVMELKKENPADTKPPKGYKINPLYVETKTRRLQLVLQPSLYTKVKAQAQKQNLSVNEYVHSILEIAVDNE